jgi:hypothetical protein
MLLRENGRLPGTGTVGTGAAVGATVAFGLAPLGAPPRADLQLPQNRASAAFSNPHLHFMDRHLSRRITKEQSQ